MQRLGVRISRGLESEVMGKRKKTPAEKVQDLVAKAEKIKERLVKERDKLRDVIADLEEIEGDASEAVYNMEVGINALESGADDLSRYL